MVAVVHGEVSRAESAVLGVTFLALLMLYYGSLYFGAVVNFPRKSLALAAVVPRLDGRICADCKVRAFIECPPAAGGAA